MRGILGIAVLFALPGLGLASESAAAPYRPTAPLGFAERVLAREAVLRVMAAHQTVPDGEALTPVPREAVQRQVRQTLAESVALATLWNTPITREMLEAEVQRMMRSSVMPGRLRERFAALGDDPALIQEVVARPILADRLSRTFFASDRRIHAAAWSEAEELLRRLSNGLLDPRAPRTGRDEIEVETRVTAADQGGAATARHPGLGIPGPIEDEEGRLVIEVALEPRAGRLLVARYAIAKQPWVEWWDANRARFEVETLDTPATTAPGPAPDLAQLEVGACAPDTWSVLHGGAPDVLRDARAVWTGNLMLIWGGTHASGPGWRYDPAIDTWSPMGTAGAPPLAAAPSAVWTGTRMIVWGGSRTGVGAVNTGGAYDPIGDTWTPTSTVAAPSARQGHTAVWTGTKMIVWGGLVAGAATATGGVYDPSLDQWTATKSLPAGSRRADHTAVWTGDEMIVWGGCDATGSCHDDGASYDPAVNKWSQLPAGAPTARGRHTAVWTGTTMIVWGGSDATGVRLNTGARYDPAGGWSSTATVNAPTGRNGHTTVWSGTNMIVWGGLGGPAGDPTFPADGGRYDPVADAWSPTQFGGGNVQARFGHVAVWTGARMVVWGGITYSDTLINSGGRYDPVSDSWTPTSRGSQPPLTQPPLNSQHTFWTGNEFLLWNDGYSGPSNGGRYDPATDSWSLVTPPPWVVAQYVDAVWTGTRMITFGGTQSACCCQLIRPYPFFPSGVNSYDPLADTWTTLASGPEGRGGHTMVWTGGEVVVWGGAWEPPCQYVTLYPPAWKYDPVANAWQLISESGGPVRGPAASSATGYRTDYGVLLWEAQSTGAYLYHPETDTWTQAETAGSPTSSMAEAYAAGRFVVLGTQDSSARYDPVTDTWSPVSAGGPDPKCAGLVASSGTQLLWWGGWTGTGCSTVSMTGARYDPVADAWVATSSINAPPFHNPTTHGVWNGQQVMWWDVANHLGFAYCMPGNGPCYADLDGDGFGAPGASLQCDDPGVVWNSLDCNDGDPLAFPGAPERCNNADDDCDGNGLDAFPTACGVGPCAATGTCNAGVDSCVPGLPAPEACNGIDDDCDGSVPPGEVDSDHDGTSDCGDCDAAYPVTYPDAPEANDGLDNQCAGDIGFGLVDEVSGSAGLAVPSEFCWEAQLGATRYEVLRSTRGDLAAGCTWQSVPGPCWSDPLTPRARGRFHYLVRAIAPLVGSWGADSAGSERSGDCDGFHLLDTAADDAPATALADFFASTPALPTDYIHVSSSGGGVQGYEWCAQRADFYRSGYLQFAATGGWAISEGWDIWYRHEGEAWTGPQPTFDESVFGDQCSGPYSWCPELELTERNIVVAPGDGAQCEAQDLPSGCGDGTWVLAVSIGADRMTACGF